MWSNTLAAVFDPQIRAWRGQAPLSLVFWGHGVFVSLIFVAAFVDALYRGVGPLQAALLPLFVAYTGWVLVAIWRCAEVAREPWGIIARLLTIAWGVNAALVAGSLQLELLEKGLHA